jgi:translation initiation factor 3 subunit B
MLHPLTTNFLQLENGYAIWNFRGQEVEKHVLDHFKQFLWRPRPRTLLSKSQQREIRKKFREYGKVFDEEDAADASNVSAELITQRKRLVDEWNAWRMRCKRELGADAVKKLDQKAEQSTAKEEIEVWVEELVEEIFEVVEDE